MPCIPSLSATHPASTFAGSFFAPLLDLLIRADNQRVRPELTDPDWLRLGVRRVIEALPSGRAFLHHLALGGANAPDRSHFFETLKSARRLAVVAEVSNGLAAGLPPLPGDWWGCVPELAHLERIRKVASLPVSSGTEIQRSPFHQGSQENAPPQDGLKRTFRMRSNTIFQN